MPIIVPSELGLLRTAQDDEVSRALPLRNGGEVAFSGTITYVFVIFTQRTGSFYLTELISSSKHFNNVYEDLDLGAVSRTCAKHDIGSFSAYFSFISQKNARNGFFIVKSTIAQLATLAWHGALQRILPRSRFIVVERMDKLAQVISWSIADQTKRFQSYAGPPDVTPVYDGENLRERLTSIVQQNAQAALFLGTNGIVPLHVTYERLVAAPLPTSRLVCGFLGCPDLVCDPAEVKLRRQATELNTAWRQRFLAERAQTSQA